MTVNDLNILEKKKQSRFVFAWSFLALCIILSGGIFIYSYSVNSQLDTLESSLSEIRTSISQRESDPLIQSYMLYQRNKDIFSRLEYISQIPDHVSHVKLTMLRYGLTAVWFSYNDGIIQTRVTSDNDTRGFWYEKVRNFVSWYRADPESPFYLSFIDNFAWHDRIQHEVSLELKEWFMTPVSQNDDELVVPENTPEQVWTEDTPEDNSELQ